MPQDHRPGSAARLAFVRFVMSHGSCDMAEWMVFVVILVDVHARAGETATGIAALAMLAPYLLVSPYTGQLTLRVPAHRVRIGSFAMQFLGYAAAAAAVLAGGSIWLAVAGCMVATSAITALRPANAILLPSIVHSGRELTRANLWLHHIEGVGAVFAPIAAAGLMAVGGAELGIIGVVAVSLTALGLASGAVPHPAVAADEFSGHPVREFVRQVRTVGRRRGAKGIIALVIAQWAITSVVDLVIVITAIDAIEMGEASAGVLTAVFAAGALLSVGVSNVIARWARLAPAIISLIVLVIACSALLAWRISAVTLLVALPLLGMSHRLLTLIPRLLLQRSASPEALGTIFSMLEFGSGAGLVLGSLAAQLLILAGGPGTAMWGLAIAFALLLAASGRALMRSDDLADVPVVTMSLIRRSPVFGPLPSIELETIARSSTERVVDEGQTVVRQGEPGEEYFVIAEGRFDVSIDGAHVRTLERGDAFGEIALLANAARTATVTATTDGTVVVVDREPFLMAVTGHEAARRGAHEAIADFHMGDDASGLDLAGPGTTPDR